MNRRHHLLQAAFVSDKAVTAASNLQTKPQEINIPGWRIMDEKLDWKPCPIGVFYSHNSKSEFQQLKL
jgi:hypothetical protein